MKFYKNKIKNSYIVKTAIKILDFFINNKILNFFI